MPSPLAHSAIGYVVFRIYKRKFPSKESKRPLYPLYLLIIMIAFSLLPDLDSIIGVMTGNFARYHNNISHSLLFGLMVSICIALIVRLITKSGFLIWFIVVLVSYEMHVVMDYLTVGRGVMMFWPFSTIRYSSHIKLFYGFHWSDGILSWKHLITIATESIFGMVLFLSMKLSNLFQIRLDVVLAKARRKVFD